VATKFRKKVKNFDEVSENMKAIDAQFRALNRQLKRWRKRIRKEFGLPPGNGGSGDPIAPMPKWPP